MENENLLKIAKSHKPKKQLLMKVEQEHIDLAIAWLNDDINYNQINYALNPEKAHTGNGVYVYPKLLCILKEAYKRNKLCQKK